MECKREGCANDGAGTGWCEEHTPWSAFGCFICGRVVEGGELTRPYCAGCHRKHYRHLGGERAEVLHARLERMTHHGTLKDRAACEWALAEMDRLRAQRDTERAQLIRELETTHISAAACGVTEPRHAAVFEVVSSAVKRLILCKLMGDAATAGQVVEGIREGLMRLGRDI